MEDKEESKKCPNCSDAEAAALVRKQAAKLMYIEGMPSKINKLTIHGDKPYDLYLVTAYYKDQLNYIDIFLSGQHHHNTRALVEVACKQARLLLRHKIWDAQKLVATWGGYAFQPAGLCPQLQGIVKSPLDAVAREIAKRGQEK